MIRIAGRAGVISGLRFIIFNLLLILFSRDVTCDDSRFDKYACPTGNYTYSLGSTFQKNLNDTLFSILPTKATASHFFNYSVGQGIDKIYALYMCRGDIDAQSCHGCIRAAANTLVQKCQPMKEGIIWYKECLLRYANRTIFSQAELTPIKRGLNYTSSWGAHDLSQYSQNITDAMNGLIKKVSDNSSLRGYDTIQIDLSPSHTWRWRGLAQCTPDILGNQCYTCLSAGLKQWDPWAITDVFLPSCLIRFDLYGFRPPPPPDRPDPKSSQIIRIVLPSIIAVLLLLSGLCFWKACYHEGQWQFNHTQEPKQQDRSSDHKKYIADLPTEEKWISVDGEIREPRTARVKLFSYSEIESMTSGFRRSLGEGGFGYVYYSRLAEDGRSKDVAVKVLSKDAPKQFSTEIAVFGKISHKNLVSLIGYCEEPENLALVYEYMAGGDLKALLSVATKGAVISRVAPDGAGSDSLSWKTRLQIAIDSAQGLDYLHHGCRPAIIHRDVKTPNILLNQHLRAKIADFGFSKIFPDEYISVLSTRVIGTPGYVDPQYHLTGQLNEKSDVYSFGVVLLELITSKEAIVSREKTLVQWVRPVLERGDLESIVDPRLPQVENRSSLWRAIDLAMECVKLSAAERPATSHIVSELKECLTMEMEERSPIGPDSNSKEIMSLSISTVMGPTAR